MTDEVMRDQLSRLLVDWERFASSIKAQAIADAAHMTAIEKRLGISHARMVNAAQGKPVGTEIFLTLCHWMQQDPLWYCVPTNPEPSHD